jgi:hypothetical protein
MRGMQEHEFEYDADYSEVLNIVQEALEQDGYAYEEADDELISEYIDNCWSDIRDYFYLDAYNQWKDNKEYDDDPLGYYGFSIHDFI